MSTESDKKFTTPTLSGFSDIKNIRRLSPIGRARPEEGVLSVPVVHKVLDKQRRLVHGVHISSHLPQIRGFIISVVDPWFFLCHGSGSADSCLWPNGSGSGSRSCYFRPWPLRRQLLILLFEGTFKLFLKDKKSLTSHKTHESRFWGIGSRSVPLN